MAQFPKMAKSSYKYLKSPCENLSHILLCKKSKLNLSITGIASKKLSNVERSVFTQVIQCRHYTKCSKFL